MFIGFCVYLYGWLINIKNVLGVVGLELVIDMGYNGNINVYFLYFINLGFGLLIIIKLEWLIWRSWSFFF